MTTVTLLDSNAHLGGVRAPARVLVVLALVSSLLGGASPPAAAEGVAVARTTTITAQGHSGTVIRVPQDATLEVPDIDLIIDEGEFAFAVLAQHGCNEFTNALCWTHRAITFAAPGWEFGPPGREQIASPGGPQGGGMPSRDYDVYIVTDGAARLVLTFEEAPPGEVTIPATGTIDVILERLGPECLDHVPCEVFSYGSATHEVNRPGLVVSTALAYHQGPGYRTVANCIDPRLFDGPPSTGDTTLGCPTLPGEDDSEVPGHALDVVGSGTPGIHQALTSTHFNNDPAGLVRVGYSAGSFGLAHGHAGYGIWLNGGIR